MGDFLTVYEPLLEAGDDVLSIHLSGGISGTVEAARQARDALVERGIAAERIEVLDSDTGCAGHGLMAIAARNAARGGADLAGAAAAARELRERMTIIFAVDTLEYLRRGGRIGAAQAWVGSALKIKPILSIDREIHADRARPHRGPRVRAAGRPPRARQHDGRRRRVLHPAHPGARRRRRASPRAGRRSTGGRPSSCRRSGP